jgi:hypothetical protein
MFLLFQRTPDAPRQNESKLSSALGFSFILIESERIDGVNAGFVCELAHEAKDADTASETKSQAE